MTPGPTLILLPRGCLTPLRCSTIGSGNTFGALFWTDGKCEAPMLPDEPSLLKHPTESVLFWRNQCKEIGEIDFWSNDAANPEWNDLPEVEEPNETDYLAALNSPLSKPKSKEKYIRMRLWWLGNDPIRRDKTITLSDSHQVNMLHLLTLLKDKTCEELLMKAEILRELSRFDEALLLLQHPFPKDYQDAVKQIKKLAIAQKHHVAVFA
jgi:hypothetical protein